jgi:amino acid transporter
MCYAELAAAYPRDGGDYEYLNRAFGPWCGFLFAWAQITTVISGNIAIMAYVFADYAARMLPQGGEHTLWLTLGPIAALSALNAVGVVAGKVVQNVLTAVKVLGLGGIVVAGLFSVGSAKPQAGIAVNNQGGVDVGLALVFVLYAYGGWSHAVYVAAEVRDGRRNLPRALVLGITGIMLIYLAVNGAYLAALGFERARLTSTPAVDVLEVAVGLWGGRAIGLLVMLSALGAINGMILTGSRIYAVWGADYPALAWLGAWNRRTATPIAAIAFQAAVAALLVALVGTSTGRNVFDAALQRLGIDPLPWEKFPGGFEMLVAGSAPVFWGLCLLTGLAVFVLRFKDRGKERSFAMPLFPLPALVFCATCAFMLRASLAYAGWLTLLGVVPLALGGVLWLAVRSNR